jgi:hypothetical protein
MFSIDALERVHEVTTTMLGWSTRNVPERADTFSTTSAAVWVERGKQIIGSARANPGLPAPLPSTVLLDFASEDHRKETQKSKERARAAFGSDHCRSAFESATGALPATCNFGTTDVYTEIGPTQ